MYKKLGDDNGIFFSRHRAAYLRTVDACRADTCRFIQTIRRIAAEKRRREKEREREGRLGMGKEAGSLAETDDAYN